MKILHCIPSMAGGGAERQLTYLSQGLVALGIETHVALARGGENRERLIRSGAVVHEIPLGNNHSPALPVALHRLIRRLKPDVVQTWLTQMDVVAGAVALWNRVPWVVTERNSAGRYSRGIKDRLRLCLGTRASALVANSTAGVAYWEPHLRPATGRHVISNGLPIDEIEAAPILSPAQSPAGPGEKLILFAGRLHPAKNVDGLIAALARLRGQLPFKAVLFGQGPERSNLEQLIAEFGLAEVVSLRDYTPCLWSWMKRADVFASVSFSEGQPNTVMEAMAARCPLVVSDIPEHREFLDPARARLVPPSDPDAIANALLEYLRDRAVARAGAEAASRRAAQWSIESMSRRYLDLYDELIRPRIAPRRAFRHPARLGDLTLPLERTGAGRPESRTIVPAETGSRLGP